MIIGRRAERWHAAIVSPAHVITSVSTFQHDIDYSNAEMIELIYNKLCDRYACSIDSALVFGDVVTSDEIGNLKHHDALRAIKIGRLHPFRHVHTNLDQLHSERIIKRAHVVSPLAGVVLTASKS
jgi:L-rhamnose isomerase